MIVEKEAVREEAIIIYKIGDKNQEIKDFQKKLYNIGYDITVDGNFGSKTSIF